jgi:hypothetical protein
MRVDLRCKVCQTKLAAKSELAGKSVRCPRCGNPVRVALAPVVLPQIGKAASPMMATPVDDEPMMAEVLPEGNDDFDVLPDDEPMEAIPVVEPPPPRPRPSRPAIVQPVVTQPAETVADEATEEDTPKPKKKKKKSGFKKAKKEATSIPTWMWVVGGLGAMITTGGIIVGLILMMRMNTPDGDDIDWRIFALEFMIGVPASLVILVISMFLSSALGGGINFGDAKTAIIGAIFLVVIVNLVAMIPKIGIYLTLLVWLVGFMTIFGLDPWEARFLLFINWVLNYAIGMAMLHYMINRVDSMEVNTEEERPARRRRRERERDPDDEADIFKNEKNNKNNNKRRVPDPNDEDEQSYLQPEVMHERMRAWVESQYNSLTNTLNA